jgi:putative membrane protein
MKVLKEIRKMDLNVNVNVIIASKDDVVLLEDVLTKLGKGSYAGIPQVVTPDIVHPITPVEPVAPVTPVEPTAPTQTVTPVAPTTPAVPVSEKTYTLEDIQRASAALVQGGKIAQLQALLQQFNAISLAHLSQDNFGAFALKLRELGADI